MRLTDLEVLSPHEMREIHESSLQILEKGGFVVDSTRILELLDAKGCSVDYGSKQVKFPPNVVEDCLAKIAPTVEILDRDGKTAFVLGDGNRYCASGHNAVFYLEDENGQRRDSTLQDVADFAIVSDYLSEVDAIGVPVMPQDVHAKTTLLHAIKAILENSKKPLFFSSESEQINLAVLEMAQTLLKKSSFHEGCNFISQLSTTSPLYWERGAAESLYILAQAGMPLDFLPQPITGVTAPYTLAGILALHNAEVLSGVVIAKLVNPEAPVVYGAAWTTYDMKFLNVLIGRPESSLLRIAGAQMAHYYHMPCHTTAPDNDVNVHDEQASWEKMLSAVAGIIGANDMIVNLGMFGTGMTISLEQLVMDNEMCRIIKRFLRGIEVNQKTIAVETIINVGPKGNFLMEDHTLEFLRSGEHAELQISNSVNYEVWKAQGAKNIVQRAREKTSTIIAGGNRAPLQPGVSENLAAIIHKYE